MLKYHTKRLKVGYYKEVWFHCALDINITDKLLIEGLSRFNRIQNVRKEQGLDVTDKIIIYLKKIIY